MKLGVIVYLPPPTIGYPLAFLKNLKNFPPANELIVYSDHDYSAEWPGAVRLGASPEVAKTSTNAMAVNNLVFYVGLRIAIQQKGWTHVMILEPDCRVNCAGFDEILFQEILAKNRYAIAAGSVAIFNPCSFNRAASERFERFVCETRGARPVPLSITGSSNLAEHRDSCIFPNGAFAVYRLDWLLKTYPQIAGATDEYINLSKTKVTWDYQVGIDIWKEFKEQAYDKIVSLDKIYSGYKNVMSSEEERQQWLTEEKIIGVHQIKSEWPGPDPAPVKEMVPMPLSFKVAIMIVTYGKDFPYLRHCLRSIKKFATGFSGVTIVVPWADVKELRKIIEEIGIESVTVKGGNEWVKKGFLWHLAQICRADCWIPDADYVAHFDPDCIFTKPVTPRTFFQGDRPVLRYEPFESLAKRHPGTWNWKIACDNALPFNCADEGMRGHPEVYHIGLYKRTRELVEEKTGKAFDAYVKSTKNDYPQTFAEFPTLSAVALEKFRDQYYPIDLSKTASPDRSPWPVIQFWSHRPPDEEQEIWIDGLQRLVIPIQLIKETLK